MTGLKPTPEADRLAYWGAGNPQLDEEAKDDFGLALREALAAERRATVQRIRERASRIDYRGPRMIGWDDLRVILDEVANAQEELRTADAKAAR